MSLESATYVQSLNSGNPAEDDLASDGDDHIRLIKAVLKATFPTLTGAVTPTLAEINKLAGMTSTGAELNKLTGVTVGPTQFNYLTGLTVNVMDTMNGMNTTFTAALAAAVATWTTAIAATNTEVATKQDDLGFIPVTEGDGDDMGTNRVYIGSDATFPAKMRAQIDDVPLGFVVTGATETVGKEIAGMAQGAVGDIGLMAYTPGTAVAPGATVAGSDLRWTGLGVSSSGDFTGVYNGLSVPSGSWKALCNLNALVSGASYAIGIFKRVS